MVMTQEPRPTPELLPCPFCGGKPWEHEDYDRGLVRYVMCTDCDAEGPLCDSAGTDDEIRRRSIDLWNNRTARTLTPEQVERARRYVGQCNHYVRNTANLTPFESLMLELLREVVGDE